MRRPKNGLRSGLIWESSGKCQGSNKNPLKCGWAVSKCKDENELNIQCLSKEAAEGKPVPSKQTTYQRRYDFVTSHQC